MLRNTAGQTITALLLDAAGAAVTTGTTSVYVTGDGGTQASGGTATHEGQGVWSFLPSQANTNYGHISFAFVNTGAVTVNLNVYPDATYDRLGAPIAASISADLQVVDNFVDTEITAIKAVTDVLPDAGALSSLAQASDLATVDGVVDAVKVKTDQMVYTKTNELDVNAKSINDAEVVGDGNATGWDGI